MKRILISNGRSPITLDFIRNLHYANHEIYAAETSNLHLSRFSNCVKKCFVVPSPRLAPDDHIKSLVEIIEDEQIDLFIPAREDIFLVSKHLKEFPKKCSVFASRHPILHKLHHKSLFILLMESHNIKTPKSVTLESEEDLKKVELPSYALKPCFSNASQSIYKISKGDPLPEIRPTKSSPWIAQEWLEGDCFCTYSLCHKGKVHAHATYPVDFTIQKRGPINRTKGNYCMTFKAVDHPQILEWVQNFCRKITFTGQIAFDFVKLPSGELYAIKCNPIITSGVTLFSKESGLDEAVFGLNKTLINADPSIKKQITTGMLLYGWRSAITCKKLPLFFKRLLSFNDLVFSAHDLKPFFAQIFLWLTHLIDSRWYKNRLHDLSGNDLDFNG